MKVAIIGIQGVPNNYGGFETLTENLLEHLSEDFSMVVYCSSKDMQSKPDMYKGAQLKYIPVTSHGAMGMLYDSLSLLNTIRDCDKILILGFGAGFVMPFLQRYKSKIIVNIGGLDWKRSKWSWLAKKVIRFSEKLLLRYSGSIISDNPGIQRYITDEHKRQSTLIAYGGDQATKQQYSKTMLAKYPFLGGKYAFAVTRIQSDNNIEMILEAFDVDSPLPFVMVGNWNSSPYGQQMKLKYQHKTNLILLEAIYERKLLDSLRSNCTFYIHGHSAGGTNPSLVEAMYLELPVFAFASGYNEYTTENAALYFHNVQQLKELIRNYRSLDIKCIGKKLKTIADRSYRWSKISEKYKEVFLKNSPIREASRIEGTLIYKR